MATAECAIWGTPADLIEEKPYGDSSLFESSRAGGRYRVTGTALAMLKNVSEREQVKLTDWLIGQRALGESTPQIDSKYKDRISASRDLTIPERRNRILRYGISKSNFIGARLSFGGVVTDELIRTQNELMAHSSSTTLPEVLSLLRFCAEDQLIEYSSSSSSFTLTFKGYNFIEEATRRGISSNEAFIAMWFHESLVSAYEQGFESAVRDAGYDPIRIDRVEHNNDITDEIIAAIRRSRFVVADFTCEPDKPRGGVYFEAGVAFGRDIPVIWCCREDLIGSLHFDTRQFSHISWKNPEDIYLRLRNRIEAVIGRGAKFAQS